MRVPPIESGDFNSTRRRIREIALIYSLLATGRRLQAIGYWLLPTGYSLLPAFPASLLTMRHRYAHTRHRWL